MLFLVPNRSCGARRQPSGARLPRRWTSDCSPFQGRPRYDAFDQLSRWTAQRRASARRDCGDRPSARRRRARSARRSGRWTMDLSRRLFPDGSLLIHPTQDSRADARDTGRTARWLEQRRVRPCEASSSTSTAEEVALRSAGAELHTTDWERGGALRTALRADYGLIPGLRPVLSPRRVPSGPARAVGGAKPRS